MSSEDVEAALGSFIEPLGAQGVNVRSIAHAWMSAGGQALVGKLTIRLTSGGEASFTGATIHAGDVPRLELSRVLLEQHGVDWLHWSDEFADLGHHGFDAAAKFPTVTFDDRLTPAELARLVVGIRDLAAAVSG